MVPELLILKRKNQSTKKNKKIFENSILIYKFWQIFNVSLFIPKSSCQLKKNYIQKVTVLLRIFKKLQNFDIR